jgi:type I restriction enzyme S subunit
MVTDPKSGWPIYTLTDVFEIRSGLSKPAADFGSGFPFVTFKDVLDHYFLPETLGSLVRSSETERELCDVRRGDVFLTRTSETQEDLGMSSVALRDYPDATFNGFTKRLRPKGTLQIVPEYAAYFLRSPRFRAAMSGFSSLSTRASLNNDMISRLQITLPDVVVQEAIGYTLRSLDDKIEQNRRTGRKLEALARAVFKAWFVDFEPVRAKASGATAFPGMPPETFATLPTRLVDSEVGPVPEGWETRSLYSAARFINGAAFKSSHFCERSAGMPVVKIAELKSGITNQTEFSNRTDLDRRYQIDTGDVLYSWSGSPDTSLDTFIWTKGRGLLNQHIFRVITESDSQKTFVYYQLKHLKQDLIEIARNKQTTGLGHVTVRDMQRLMLPWPGRDVIDAFHRAIGPVFALNFNNLLESEKLATLRDYLLPRLLSGRVRVTPMKEANIIR